MKRVIVFTFIALYTMCVYSQEATIDGIRYYVISPTEAEVSRGDKSATEFMISEYVTIKNKKYKVTTIDSYAFKECTNLTSITIPNSVTTIGSSAFKKCTNLTSITIPNSVTAIETFAFNECTNLTSITIPNSVTTIGSFAFEECTNLTSITIPNGVTAIGEGVFHGCASLTSITIPNGVTTIGNYAFSSCTNLTSITIPNSVTAIGSYAFYKCTNLTSITIPNSVTTIGDSAFSGCTNLTSLTIPNSVTTIGESIFFRCDNLKEVVIPDNINSIKRIFSTEKISTIKGHNIKYPRWFIKHILEAVDSTGNPLYGDYLTVYQLALEAKKNAEHSYNDYIYYNIKQLVSDWQKKKDYETTEQWYARVNENNQKEKVQIFKKELDEKYFSKYKYNKIYSTLGMYDADFNTYSVKLNDKDTVFIDVPIEDVEYVKSKWSKVKVLEPKYGIVNDRLGILSAKFKLGKKIYNCTQIHNKSTADLAINLPPLEFEIDGNNKSKSSAVQVAVDNSIDINIPTNSSDNSNTFAIIIGNEDYQQVSKVQYAKNDAKIFAAYCEKTLGLPKKNIKLYQDATFGIMLSAVENIQNIAKAFKGDINIIFYYAGHGVPNESTNEAFLLPTDANGSNTAACYPISKLLKELKELNANSVTVFMDACFSGAQRGEGMLASARGVAIKAKKVEPQGNMVVFSAASADETAYPYKEKGHGLFTYFLLKKLNETKGDVTLGELGDYISEKVAQESVVSNGKSQTPTVTVSQAVSDSWRNSKLR